MKRALLAALLLASACTKKDAPPAEAGAAVATAPAPIDARDIAERSCLSCHTMQMLEQQRLTEAQWTKVVTKMVSWGANLEASEQPALVAWLSARFGPDAGAYEMKRVAEADVAKALDPLPDPVDAGTPEVGRALYTDRCSGCHGPEARGHIGVSLVDRPFLYRADDVARTVRKGRGKMPPAKITDAEVAEILAYLRTLR